MPIYAYRCDSCGHTADVLQKISAPALTECPACGASTYSKQLTAAAFQLKGSGWYVTDFRDNGKKAEGKSETPGAEGKAEAKAETKPEASSPASAPAAGPASAPAASSPAPAAPASPTSPAK
jgi:putative FmdB family regulatory protein